MLVALTDTYFVALLGRQMSINIPCDARCFTINFISFISMEMFFGAAGNFKFCSFLENED